jgi:hypothetical protein
MVKQVEQVYPELVIHDDHGKVMGVRYDMLPSLLLNEMQKQPRENQPETRKLTKENKQEVPGSSPVPPPNSGLSQGFRSQ